MFAVLAKFIIGGLAACVSALLVYGGVLLGVGYFLGEATASNLNTHVTSTLPGVIADVIDLAQASVTAAKEAFKS